MLEWIQSIDFQILDFIQSSIKCAFLDPIMMAFSYMGHAGAVWIVLGLTLLFFRKTRVAGVCLLASIALGFLIGDIGIKHLVMRPRPFLVNTDITLNVKAPTGYSFPSGHSTAAFAATTSLFLTIREKKWLCFSALAVALIIVFSRIYNYVHYPSDIIGGMVVGVAAALIIFFIVKKTKLDKKLSGDLRYKSQSE